MAKVKIVMGLGILIGLVSLLGFPESIKKIALIVLGLTVIILGQFILREIRKMESREKEISKETYTEHRV